MQVCHRPCRNQSRHIIDRLQSLLSLLQHLQDPIQFLLGRHTLIGGVQRLNSTNLDEFLEIERVSVRESTDDIVFVDEGDLSPLPLRGEVGGGDGWRREEVGLDFKFLRGWELCGGSCVVVGEMVLEE